MDDDRHDQLQYRAVLNVLQVPCEWSMDMEAPALVGRCPGVCLRMQKLVYQTAEAPEVSVECYSQEAPSLIRAARVLGGPTDPGDGPTVTGLGCTSMSIVLGPERIDADLPAPSTDTARAVAAAIRHVGPVWPVRVGLVTPYTDSVHARTVEWLETDRRVRVTKSVNLGMTDSSVVSRIPFHRVRRLVGAMAGTVDVVVVSCTGVRVCVPGLIPQLEAMAGVPVVTSTQALLWHMLRLAGVDDRLPEYGRLFG